MRKLFPAIIGLVTALGIASASAQPTPAARIPLRLFMMPSSHRQAHGRLCPRLPIRACFSGSAALAAKNVFVVQVLPQRDGELARV